MILILTLIILWVNSSLGCTVEPPIKDTIEITSEQRTRFNVPNGDFPIFLTSDKGQPLNKGQMG